MKAIIASFVLTLGTLSSAHADVPLTPVSAIAIPAGSSVIVETRNDGVIQYTCPAAAPAPIAQVAPQKMFSCSRAETFNDVFGNATNTNMSGMGNSVAAAFQALQANCPKQLAAQMKNPDGTPYDGSSYCSALFYGQAGTNCVALP